LASDVNVALLVARTVNLISAGASAVNVALSAIEVVPEVVRWIAAAASVAARVNARGIFREQSLLRREDTASEETPLSAMSVAG